jgi:TatD DNase family protein
MFGLHPCSVKENWKEELRLVEHDLFNNSSKLNPIAVGEIGLDLYWERSFLEQQVEALEIQINWAKKLGLPIVIHVRDAFDEIFEVIDSLNDDSLTGVFHCFTGNLSQANHILDYGGFKLGLGGVLTFKNSGLDKTIEQIDLKHLILETDSPYLAPHPHRGKRNEPAYLMLVAKKLAEVKGVLLEEVSRVTEINTNEIFFPKQLED